VVEHLKAAYPFIHSVSQSFSQSISHLVIQSFSHSVIL